MRKTILSLVFLLAALTATAAEAGSNEFVCTLNNGAIISWLLTEEPKVELISGQLVISSTRATVTYNSEEVKQFTLRKNITGIESVSADGSASPSGAVEWSGSGLLIVKGCKAGEAVAVYSSDGQQRVRQNADANGTLTISTESLPAGVYIVKSRSVNLKFIKQ